MSTFKHIYNEKLKAIAEQKAIDPKDVINSHFKKIKEVAKKGLKYKATRADVYSKKYHIFDAVIKEIGKQEKLMKSAESNSIITKIFHNLNELNKTLKEKRFNVKRNKDDMGWDKKNYMSYTDPILNEIKKLLNFLKQQASFQS